MCTCLDPQHNLGSSFRCWNNKDHQQSTPTHILYVYTGCVRKKLYNFQLRKKVNKAQHQHSGGQNIIFLWVRRFLNGIIPWSGVKVMVHRVKSSKNKVGHFRHYYEGHSSSPIGETYSDQYSRVDADVYMKVTYRPSCNFFAVSDSLTCPDIGTTSWCHSGIIEHFEVRGFKITP